MSMQVPNRESFNDYDITLKLRSENSHMDNIFENLTNQEIDNALYGLFLGDGTYKHGSIYIQHTEKQHFYCEWLNEQLDFTTLNHSIYRNQKFKTTFGEHIYHIVRISVFDRARFELYNQCTDKNKHKTILLA